MPYQGIVLDEFGGLDLTPDTASLGLGKAAVCWNVDVAHQDRLQPRPGTDTLVTLADYNATSIGQGANDTIVQWQGATPKVRVYGPTGTQLGTIDCVTGGFTLFELAGVTLLCFGDVSFGLRYWGTNTDAFGSNATVPATWLACATSDQRLALARNATYPSRVWFSDPGLPTTFQPDNWVDLDPGDGECITNLVRWRDLMFAFKRTKFYVFYATSTDSLGAPIFENRPVDVGVGATGTYDVATFNTSASAVATRDGVYFQADDGMYLTTGEAPRKISQPLEAWFTGESSTVSVYSPPAATGDFQGCSVGADNRYVYFRPEGLFTFAYSLDSNRWGVFNEAVLAAAPFEAAESEGKSLYGTVGALKVRDPRLDDDDGTAITWAYRTGSSDLGAPERKTIYPVQVWGTGSVTLSVYTDDADTDAGASSLTLGTYPAPAQATQMYARAGTFFSLGVVRTGQGTVNRMVMDVRERWLAGVG